MSINSVAAIFKRVWCVVVLSLMPIGIICAQELLPPKKLPPEILDKKSVYGSVIGAYQVQGARVLQTTPDSIYNIGEFAGGSFSYVIGALYRWGPKWGGHLGFINRNIVLNGNSTAQGSAVVNKFELERNFLGAEMGIHFYPMKSSLSYLANLELSQEQRVRLKVVGGSPIDQSGIKLKPIVLMSAGIIYNWKISPRYALQQELRLGGIVANPPIVVGEARLSIITGL